METTSKKRAPSRCREWERNRRNKFNEAISKLGEIVKSIITNNPGKDKGDTQYAKIEIIQKAIICLENCTKEKTQMKAEILALQVSLDGFKNRLDNKKDASTQVQMIIGKRKQNNKVIVLQSNRRKALKEKLVNNDNVTTLPAMKPILPKCNIIKKGGPENTIVLMPASPYIFPQRPVLYPAVPPTIFLLDPNQLNKSNVPNTNRNTNDITKTTMVNILPISAYSRPLSATKNKKKSKAKCDKKPKKSKVKESKKTNETATSEPNISLSQSLNLDLDSTNKNKHCEKKDTVEKESNSNPLESESIVPNSEVQNVKEIADTKSLVVEESNQVTKKADNTIANNSDKIVEKLNVKIDNNLQQKHSVPKQDTNEIEKFHNDNSEKDRDKENKLPNILDATLCENAVDTGNARLELAEELLAASPTAAFLMSFPLVSGNRADSPSEESQNIPVSAKDTINRRSTLHVDPIQYSEKEASNETKKICNNKIRVSTNLSVKLSDNHKYLSSSAILMNKSQLEKPIGSTMPSDNPFLPMPSIITTTASTIDTSFSLDFDCNITKPYSSQSSNYSSTNNIFYKNDPFNSVKNAIYSTSSITTSHDFNNIGLYPCAMEKYSTKSNTNIDDNLMKIGSSRLTYDIDLGWSHKSLDFINCSSANNTFTKDNILTTVPMSAPYSSSYNPFNPDFHVQLVANTNKKENTPKSSFPEITNFYSQAPNVWSEDVPFYTSNNIAKSLPKQPNYLSTENMQLSNNSKQSQHKQFETKHVPELNLKATNLQVADNDKFTKKSPTKMHINWMTSEVRSMQRDQNFQHTQTDLKDIQKPSFVAMDNAPKKIENSDTNYFPLPVHSFPTQPTQEEFQVWPSTRGVGTAEITIEPPPINLPTLVGDLALGPHDKKKNIDGTNKPILQPDIQNCGNFLSVTQLMNRSSDSMSSRYQGLNIDLNKATTAPKQQTIHTNETSRKPTNTRSDTHQAPSCYNFIDNKSVFDNSIQFTQQKPKHPKTEKNAKVQKINYSAEALIRGGGPHKVQGHNDTNKFLIPTQKYNDYNANDSSVAQVSHFPSVIDYSDNNYAGQQYTGTALYNSTTNTLSNSFYTNFMPSNGNIMTGNFSSGPYPTEFVDYNQTSDCNFTNQKYEDLKMKNNAHIFQQEKVATNCKSSRRDSAAKHKLECKKESNKKYQSKRTKISNDTEEWSDTSSLLWQNKGTSRRHGNFVSEELPFPNYNQMPSQYQSEFFNSHLMSTNVQSVASNVDRSLGSFPIASRANFNLSTIFPEITMKVQS